MTELPSCRRNKFCAEVSLMYDELINCQRNPNGQFEQYLPADHEMVCSLTQHYVFLGAPVVHEFDQWL